MLINRIGFAVMLITTVSGCLAQQSNLATDQDTRSQDLWKSNMVEFGHLHGKSLAPDSNNKKKLADQYYDSTWVFYQIADYLGEEQPWHTYAEYSMRVYVDEYLKPNRFRAQGYRKFPHGIYESLLRQGSGALNDLVSLRDKSSYSTIRSLRKAGGHVGYSREVAYSVQTNIYAEKAGAQRVLENGKPRLESFVTFMGSHLYEWRTRTYIGGSAGGEFAPFKFGLTAHALIEFYEWERANGRDPNAYWPVNFPVRYHDETITSPALEWGTVVEGLADVASYMYEEASMADDPETRLWVEGSGGTGSFRYVDHGNSGPSPDLNLLIAPTYAWLYRELGDEKYLVMAERIFNGGVQGAWLKNGKQFNQNYRLSFLYVRWREEGLQRWAKGHD